MDAFDQLDCEKSVLPIKDTPNLTVLVQFIQTRQVGWLIYDV